MPNQLSGLAITRIRGGNLSDQANSTIAIAYVSCAVVAAWIISKDGFVGLIVVAILDAIIAIGLHEGAIERMRYRRLRRWGRLSLR